MIAAAITLYDLVPTGSVVAGHDYGDPASLSVGTNTDLASTTDPVQPDLGLAGVIGWTQPANAAVDPAVVVPGYGAGTAELIDALPVVVGRGDKPTPQSTCAFIGENRELLIVPVDNNDNQIDAGTDALQYVAESLDGNDVQVTTIAPQNPTTGEIAIPTMASGVNAIVGSYRWSVRNDSTGIVVAYGTHETEAMAVVGNPTPDKGVCIRIGNQQDGSPIEGATVRVTQDMAGLVQVAAFVTGADGIVDIQVVAAGTYYAHASKAGFALGDPIEFVVA